MNDLSLQVSDADLEAYRDAVNPMRHVRDISEFIGDVVGSMFLGVRRDEGDILPWDKASHIGFRGGEVSLWMGINGHGKSAMTVQAALWWALQDKASCIASFEMLPHKTVERMLLQAAGNAMPSESFARDFFNTLKGKILIYDRRDVDTRILARVIRYTAIERGVRHFWIDSLMKCIRGEDDYNGQKDFVADLCALARELGIHIHLVHHVRKAGDEKQIPGKFDAKGTGAITDQVDQVLTVWRNKAKEAERANGSVDEGKPDFMLICDKNRHGGWEGRVALWGDLECWHFRGTQQQPWAKGYSLDRSEAA